MAGSLRLKIPKQQNSVELLSLRYSQPAPATPMEPPGYHQAVEDRDPQDGLPDSFQAVQQTSQGSKGNSQDEQRDGCNGHRSRRISGTVKRFPQDQGQ